jgi:predicted nucleic acid-binding protein
MERLALDTTFLIDLQNEARGRGTIRGATALLEAHPDTELCIPAVAVGEYLEGFAKPTSRVARAILDPLVVLPVTDEVALAYARQARRLRRAGRLIGANDLWIACTALVADLPIATRNVEHFERVRGLRAVNYATA